MKPIPFIPENAPFSADQRHWLNGYLAGLFSDASPGGQHASALLSAPAAPAKPLLVLYGSQTGTAEGLAKKVSTHAQKQGFASRILALDKCPPADLVKEQNVLVIASTYGDGEPPDNAQAFWGALRSDEAPTLAHLRYSVLALGDTNYSAFCQFGKDCDTRFEQLGATRIHPRVDCDVEYDALAQAWRDGVLSALAGESNASSPATGTVSEAASETDAAPAGYSRKNPFPARLLTNRLLNAEGSGKEVRHFEISLEGSGLSYEVGDALGVLPSNCSAQVSDILAALRCDGEEAVPAPDGTETSLRLALAHHYEITKPSSDFLSAAASRLADGALQSLLDPAKRDDLKKWLWGREIIDVLAMLPTTFSAPEFISLLKKLQPRLYSISSSPKAHPGEVHLTVAAVRYESHGRPRKGVCSTFLAERCSDSSPVPVFVQTSHGFRLPSDPQQPVIMVGPGTGIAPFRAFLEERRAIGAPGRNWLFFGDQRRSTDFLYRDELEAMSADGHLSRLDLAFSRDQAEKIYVQHRMLEAAPELWAWLQDGASFYVCGDASRMAKDVDEALHKVIETGGGLSSDAAREYVQKLKSDKRYQRDVY